MLSCRSSKQPVSIFFIFAILTDCTFVNVITIFNEGAKYTNKMSSCFSAFQLQARSSFK
jgi:hypothetical protein